MTIGLCRRPSFQCPDQARPIALDTSRPAEVGAPALIRSGPRRGSELGSRSRPPPPQRFPAPDARTPPTPRSVARRPSCEPRRANDRVGDAIDLLVKHLAHYAGLRLGQVYPQSPTRPLSRQARRHTRFPAPAIDGDAAVVTASAPNSRSRLSSGRWGLDVGGPHGGSSLRRDAQRDRASRVPSRGGWKVPVRGRPGPE